LCVVCGVQELSNPWSVDGSEGPSLDSLRRDLPGLEEQLVTEWVSNHTPCTLRSVAAVCLLCLRRVCAACLRCTTRSPAPPSRLWLWGCGISSNRGYFSCPASPSLLGVAPHK
jgi:hypothetical protein